MKVEVKKLDVLKVQRPIIANSSTPRLLIYSLDNMIKPQMIPDNGIIHDALHNRSKAYFSYHLQDGNIVIERELEMKEN